MSFIILLGGDFPRFAVVADLKPSPNKPRDFFFGCFRGRVRKLARLFAAGELLASQGVPGLIP